MSSVKNLHEYFTTVQLAKKIQDEFGIRILHYYFFPISNFLRTFFVYLCVKHTLLCI